jgi:acyl-CoA reductase-like NAD-dependent aldehyde dehydrogenase
VDEDTDLDDAVPRIIIGGYYQSGQTCISVQRILVHEKIYDDFKARFVAAVKALKTGNPKDEDTFIGPIISKAEADRMERWMNSAEAAGAARLCGGERNGNMITGAVFENVPKTEPLHADEFFGPATVMSKFSNFYDAIDEVNDSRFGLQAGVFTRDIYKIQHAWDTLDVGGVIVGDVPSFRVDHMPYGGVKDSGIGREGIRFAIEDMTEIRLLAIRTPPGEMR